MIRSYVAVWLIAGSTALAAFLTRDIAEFHAVMIGAGVWCAYLVGRFTSLERQEEHGSQR